MSSTNKIDVSTIYEMFETIKGKLDKQKNNSVEPTKINLSAIDTVTEKLENVIEEIKKPSKVEHRHSVSISNSWFFISWVGLLIIILGLSWIVGNQRQIIVQYSNNDLKYRYIKMRGQTDEENLYRLQQQFKYADSIKIIRNQVERYEELVRLQAEKLERARRNEAEIERLRKEVEYLY